MAVLFDEPSVCHLPTLPSRYAFFIRMHGFQVLLICYHDGLLGVYAADLLTGPCMLLHEGPNNDDPSKQRSQMNPYEYTTFPTTPLPPPKKKQLFLAGVSYAWQCLLMLCATSLNRSINAQSIHDHITTELPHYTVNVPSFDNTPPPISSTNMWLNSAAESSQKRIHAPLTMT